MRKMTLFLSLMMILLFTISSKAEGDTMETIFQYGTTTPIYYNGTTTPITIPTVYFPQKQSLRGVWVATISNIDIDLQNGTTEKAIDEYKKEYLDLLSTIKQKHMNAIFFQVRPLSDAFYPSSLNPWSRYITGTEGVNPNWDPLSFMVREAHAQNIQFYAWFNPYRVTLTSVDNKDSYLNTLDPLNYAYQNPDMVISDQDNKLLLNPGEPKVQQFIIDTVMEVAKHYPIDGITFDDYFYPYAGLNVLQDQQTFMDNNPNHLSLDDWRRDNVNTVIKGIKDALTSFNTQNNKAIQFGISPFGIWANSEDNNLGSNTTGLQSYYELYADSRKWVKEGWVDFIIPQIYWSFDSNRAPYADLVNWWVDTVKGTKVNLYIGLAPYRYGGSGNFQDPNELPHQLLYNETHQEITGEVYFSYHQFIRTDNETLSQGLQKIAALYQTDTLFPVMANIDKEMPQPVQHLTYHFESGNILLSWDEDQNASYYAIYRFKDNEPIDLSNTSHLITLTNTNQYHEQAALNTTYVITAFNETNEESDGVQVSTTLMQPYIPDILGIHDFTVLLNTQKPNYLNGLKAFDVFGNDISNQITYDDSFVHLNIPGQYKLIYDLNGIKKETFVKVVDNVVPSLYNIRPIVIPLHTINPNYLNGILIDHPSYSISVDSSRVQLNKRGTYLITYIIKDGKDPVMMYFTKVYVI